jgi:hypothetical protein
MSKEEGEKAGIEKYRSHFRIDNGKSNLAPPPETSEWRKLISVNLNNATEQCPADHVGVVTFWEWPNPMESLTVHDLRAVQKAVSNGGPWRKDSQAKDWIGKPIATALKLDLAAKANVAKVKGAIKVWLKTGMLTEFEDEDRGRNSRTFIKVGKWAND